MKQFFQSPAYPKGSSFRPFVYCPYCGAPLKETAGGSVIRPRCETCRYTPYYNPSPGVVVLIVKDGRVLLGKRASQSFGGESWCLPGGFLEFDENFLAAAHREVYEETGMQIEIQAVVNVVSNFLTPRLHTLVIILLAAPLSASEQPGDDIVELRWFPLQGPYPPMAFEADEYILRQVAQKSHSSLPVDPRFARQPGL